MKLTRKTVLIASLILVLLTAGICAFLRQRPRAIAVGPVQAEAVNPDAAGVRAVVEADLVRQRELFGGGSLRGSVTVDGVSYFSNEAWSGEGGTDSAGWFFRNWSLFTDAHATVEDAVNLTADGVVTVWLHDGWIELTRVEGGAVSVFRVPYR